MVMNFAAHVLEKFTIEGRVRCGMIVASESARGDRFAIICARLRGAIV